MPDPPCWDEAYDASGRPRPHYAAVLDELAGRDLAALRRRLDAEVAAAGMFAGSAGRRSAFIVDAVPRILPGAEWRRLEAGLAQRVRALDAFVADAQGERRAFAAGVVPEDVLAGCIHDEPEAREIPPAPVRIGVAGIDVVRDATGELRVLEDNVRTPAGPAVAQVCGEVLRRHVAAAPLPLRPDGVAPALWRVLRAQAGGEDPVVVLLHDGERGSAGADVAALARLLGVALVEPEDLVAAGDRLLLRDGRRQVDVVYRRTSEERLRRDDGAPTELAELLLGPLRAGTVRCMNAFGAGVADDKRLYAHVDALVRFFLDEEPLVRGVETFDLRRPDVRDWVADRLDALVLKPRAGAGGHGVLIGPRASTAQLVRARRALAEDPGAWVAQELVMLSTHPTVVGGTLEPRHVDLRAFVLFDGAEARVLPAALSRFPRDRGELVVNTGQGGGTKDTWVLP
jgi:carboxylate-amine ligase